METEEPQLVENDDHGDEVGAAVAAPAGRGFKAIELGTQVVIKGGFAKDAEFVVETKELAGNDGMSLRFVKVSKTSWWLTKMAGGPSLPKGGLKRTTLLEDLRQKIIQETAHMASPDKSTTAAVAALTERSDPMDMMNLLAATTTESSPRPAEKSNALANLRGRQRRKRLAEQVMVLTMPGRSPWSAGAGETEQRGVSVLSTSTNSLWVSEKDIPWLVCWMADEVANGGVPLLSPGKRSAVADDAGASPRIQWNFEDHAWETTLKTGNGAGQTIQCKPSQMTEAKFGKTSAARDDSKSFATAAADPVLMREAAREYLEIVALDMSSSTPPSAKRLKTTPPN